jgi:hypothetical protein
MLGIPYPNAKAINSVYVREGRKVKKNYRMRFFLQEKADKIDLKELSVEK